VTGSQRFLGTELYAVKWRNWNVHFYWQERMDDTPQKLVIPKLFDPYTNPQERPLHARGV
jgi:hypothetical protein